MLYKHEIQHIQYIYFAYSTIHSCVGWVKESNSILHKKIIRTSEEKEVRLIIIDEQATQATKQIT